MDPGAANGQMIACTLAPGQEGICAASLGGMAAALSSFPAEQS
jgi:hypothetical protein